MLIAPFAWYRNAPFVPFKPQTMLLLSQTFKRLSALLCTQSNLVKICKPSPGHSVQFQHRCTHVQHASLTFHTNIAHSRARLAHKHPQKQEGQKRRSLTRSPLLLFLHPGVGGARELVRPVWRPPRGGVEVHVVGVGFESERLAGVAVGGGRGQVDRLVLVVLLSVALRGRQVHSVAVVVLPVGLVVKWLCVLGEQQIFSLATEFSWYYETSLLFILILK